MVTARRSCHADCQDVSGASSAQDASALRERRARRDDIVDEPDRAGRWTAADECPGDIALPGRAVEPRLAGGVANASQGTRRSANSNRFRDCPTQKTRWIEAARSQPLWVQGNGNDDFGSWACDAACRFGDEVLQDPDRNGVEAREARARVLEALHPGRDLAGVRDRCHAGVEMRDRCCVQIRFEGSAASGAQRPARRGAAASAAWRHEQVRESTNEGAQANLPGPGACQASSWSGPRRR